MGLFIEVEITGRLSGPEESSRLLASCPVDIFVGAGGRVEVNREQEDECLLCERCLQAAPGKIRIYKRYSGEELL